MMSGYCHCACRDCFEITIREDGETDKLCDDCEESRCEANNGECKSPNAYGQEKKDS